MSEDSQGRPVQSVGVSRIVVTATKTIVAAGDYAAEDVISDSASAGTVWTFEKVAAVPGGSGTINKALILCQTTDQAHRTRLYLFNNSTLTGIKNDNVLSTTPVYSEASKCIGWIDYNGFEDKGGCSQTLSTPSTSGNLPLSFKCEVNNRDIYGILITLDAFTNETGTAGYFIALEIIQD